MRQCGSWLVGSQGVSASFWRLVSHCASLCESMPSGKAPRVTGEPGTATEQTEAAELCIEYIFQ